MARRRRGSFRGSRRRGGGRRGGFGGMAGNIPRMITSAGMAYAVGVGTKALVEKYAMIAGQPGLASFGKFVGAYTAWQSGNGLPGIVAAVPVILNGSVPSASGAQSRGVGAFV